MNDTKSTNNWNAKDYAESSSAQQIWAEELLKKLALSGKETILDVGCGDGKISRLIADKLPYGSVLGIDRSQEMIDLAQSKYANNNLSFMQMDASDIQLDQRFDIGFSNAALHWIENHQAVLTGLHNHLAPGGRILLQMGGTGNAHKMVRIVNEIIRLESWSEYFSAFQFPYFFYDVTPYLKWLPNAGFAPVRLELIPKDMIHQNAAGLKSWLRTTWFPYTDQLPLKLREPFLDQVINEYLKLVPLDPKDRTHVQMIRLEIEATKI